MNSSQKNIFDFPEVRVVEASAGSGKTYALAKRYVCLLLSSPLKADEVAISNILAITFTNKAAFEMKERILDFLRSIAFDCLSETEKNEIIKPLGISFSEAQKRAFTAMEQIIRHYNYFQVQTIDRFVNSFLAGCAFKVGLTSNFKIKTNYIDYLQYSLDQLLEKAEKDINVYNAFEEFLRNYLYLENRLGWFPKEDILSIISMLFNQSNSYEGTFIKGPLTSSGIIKRKSKILEDMKLLSLEVKGQIHAGFYKSLESFLAKAIESGYDIDSVPKRFANEDMPTRKSDKVSDEALKLWGKIRKNLKALCEEESASLFNPYIEVYDQVMKGFYERTTKDDVLFLSELNKRASQLFSDEFVTVEELYYRLATRFRHHLIDEFQDTSRLQWQNLSIMPLEALSTGGSLFFVGDKKQAIYGFRGGDVKLFDEVKKEFSAFNLNVETLSNNWRSQRAIVEFNNAVFSKENLMDFIKKKESYEEDKNSQKVVFDENDMEEIESIFSGSQQTFVKENNKGYVEIASIDIDKKEERDEEIRNRLLKIIKELQERFELGQIAILTRNNDQIEQVTSWLLEDQISVRSERTSDIRENGKIKELVSFLHFLNSPIDNIVFTEFIFGEIFLKASLIDPADIQSFVFGLREKLRAQQDLYVYTEFRDHYKEIWEKFISGFFKNVGIYPIYELVVSIYNEFNVLENFKDDQGFLMHFLELIKKYEEEDLDLELFLNHFENLKGDDLYVNLSDNDAIEILTLHKSKGLEFPVVILPFLGMEVQVGSQNADMRQSYLLQHKESDIELLRLKESYYAYSEELYQIYRSEYIKAFLAELNGVYVSLTRAANELYAFIPQKVGSRFNILKFLIPQELYVCGEKVKYISKSNKEAGLVRLSCGKYRNWIEYLKGEYKSFGEITNKGKRLKGKIAHFILSYIGNLSEQDLPEILCEVREQIRFEFVEERDLDIYFDNAQKLINDPDLQQYFYCKDAFVHTEKDIVDEKGNLKRLDRLIISENEVCIVDYKSSEDESKDNKEQIVEYIRIVKNIYPARNVRGAIMYIDTHNVEEVF